MKKKLFQIFILSIILSSNAFSQNCGSVSNSPDNPSSSGLLYIGEAANYNDVYYSHRRFQGSGTKQKINVATVSGGLTTAPFRIKIFNGDWMTCFSSSGSYYQRLGAQQNEFIIPAGDTEFYVHFTENSNCSSGSTSTRNIHIQYLGVYGILATTSKIDVTGCNGNSNGSASITNSSNGTAPYSYDWTSAVVGFTPPANTNSTISNLKAGVYTCVVKDASVPQLQRTFSCTVNDVSLIGYSGKAYTTSTNCTTADLNVQANPNTIINEKFASTGSYVLSDDAIAYSGAGNVIQLTPDQSNKQGKITFNKTNLPNNFTANFRLRFNQKAGADGMSFNLGDINSIPSGNYENGVSTGLAIRFKTYNQDVIQLFWNNTQIGSDINFSNTEFLEDGRWHNYAVNVNDNTLTLKRDGASVLSLIVSGLSTPAATSRFALAARCGGSSNQCLIDSFIVTDDTPKQFSIDNGATWQTSTVFSNVTLGTIYTVKMKVTAAGCAENIATLLADLPSAITPIPINTSIIDCTHSNINFKGKATTDVIIASKTLGFSLLGEASDDAINIITLTESMTYTKGAVVFNETVSKPKAFNATFDYTLANKPDGGDGFSFNYGALNNIIDTNNSYQNGLTTTGLVIKFFIAATDKCQLFFNNVQIGSDYTIGLKNYDAAKSYSIIVTTDGKISLTQNGNAIFTDVQLPVGYVPDATYKFAMGASTSNNFIVNILNNFSVIDTAPIQYSIDGVTWQSDDNSFKNVTNATTSLYAKIGTTGCAKKINTFTASNIIGGLNATLTAVDGCASSGGGSINISNFGAEIYKSSLITNSTTKVTEDYLVVAPVYIKLISTSINSNSPAPATRAKYVMFSKTKPKAFKLRSIISLDYSKKISFNYGSIDYPNALNYNDGISSGVVLKVADSNFSLFYNGVQIGTTQTYTSGTSQILYSEISVTADGKFTLKCGDVNPNTTTFPANPTPVTVLNGLQLPVGYNPNQNYEFAFAANNSGTNLGFNTAQMYVVDINDLTPLQYTVDNGVTFTGTNPITGLAAGSVTVKAKLGSAGCTTETLGTTTIVVNTTTAPTASTPQTVSNGATIADLTATGTALQWYANATGGNALPSTTALSNTNYYVSQTLTGCESTRTAVGVQGALTANSYSLESKIEVYPNPTNGILNIDLIDFTSAKIEIYDLNGRLLKFQKIEINNSKINISDLSKGIYLLKIDTEGGSITKRIIKE